MSKYLKLFETTAAYNAAKPNLILPNVSVCEDAPTVVHYNPLTPTPTHDYIEIGGVKWATMNIGATGITDTGLYFQWGDTQGYTADEVGCEEGKKCFDSYWSDYKWTEDGGETFTKYNESDDLTTLQSSDDAAQAAWGGSWRMPTTAEFQALGEAVNSAWTADYQGSGVSGLVLTDKTDSSKVLFFPAAGNCVNGSVNDVGSYGNYWPSSLDTSNVINGRSLNFSSGGVNWQNNSSRYYGFAVRPVLA